MCLDLVIRETKSCICSEFGTWVSLLCLWSVGFACFVIKNKTKTKTLLIITVKRYELREGRRG